MAVTGDWSNSHHLAVAHSRHIRAGAELPHERRGRACAVSFPAPKFIILNEAPPTSCTDEAFASNVRYELRVSQSLLRMAHITHESLRSCSPAFISGSMHDERASILEDLSAISPELCVWLCFDACWIVA
jgi:hypothetical protein